MREAQLSVASYAPAVRDGQGAWIAEAPESATHAAKQSLRAQIARLEHRLSEVVADGFPDIPATPVGHPPDIQPRLLGLGELERERDALVARLTEVEAAFAARDQRHRAGQELLAAMQLEPAAYKFVRLRAVDAGERGCGVWQVRPRLGPIGMLAGWWRLKLSSGCPLAKGRAPGARPGRAQRHASSLGQEPAAGPCAGGRHLRAPRSKPVQPAPCRLHAPRRLHTCGADGGQHADERASLALGHGSERLLLGHRHLGEEPAGPGLTPSALGHQQVRDSHVGGLVWTVEDHLGDVELTVGDSSLQVRSGQSDLVRALECTQVLWYGRGDRRCRVHGLLTPRRGDVERIARHMVVLGQQLPPRDHPMPSRTLPLRSAPLCRSVWPASDSSCGGSVGKATTDSGRRSTSWQRFGR